MADRTSILYDHYKDTCSIMREGVKRRDRLMLFVILTLGFFAFQTIFPVASNTAVNDFLNFKFGLNFKLDFPIVGNIVWFLLLIFTLRYFQVAVFVERQYDYIHHIEEKLNQETKEDVITREGRSYLYKYPAFSDWMWALYTIVFPALLFVVSAVKIFGELGSTYTSGWSLNLLLDVVAFILLTISIALYLIMLHKKNQINNHGL